jgi:enterochelin esterase-like enzyme
MALLGLPLLVTLAVFTVGIPVATYLLWSRVRGPRVAGVLQRGSLLALSQVAAILLVAVAMNDYGYFYTSWSDLLGGSTTTGRVVHASAEGPRAGRSAGTPLPDQPAPSQIAARGRVTPTTDLVGWSTPAQWPTRGRVETVSIAGSRSQLTATALVYLPPQYFQPAYAKTTFPAVEVLTGYPGSALNLVKRMDFPGHLMTEIAAGRAKPMALVMMRPTVAPPRDTECTDVPGGPQALTYLSEDVPAALRSAMRLRPLGWGAIGDSTGGYCAAKITMMHSDTFSAGVALSGYFKTLRDGTTGDLWGGSSVLRNLNDLEWRVGHLPSPPVSLLVTTSRQERGNTGYADTRRFISLVRPPMQVDSLILSRGGHNFAAWDAELPQAIDWLSTHLKTPG